jgi:hypothetical protein
LTRLHWYRWRYRISFVGAFGGPPSLKSRL